jgi:mono/diheme cytochrome c family protein
VGLYKEAALPARLFRPVSRRRNNVSFGLSRYAKALPPLLILGVLLPWLSGCDDTYSEAIQYTVRTDPLFAKTPTEEQLEPDRPGQLPLYTIAGLQDPRNPLYPMGAELVKNGTIRDPAKLSEDNRKKLDDILTRLFGTPAEPRVDGIDKTARETLKLDSDTLERGRQLYRLHCLQCHGVTGDGRGPTAQWVNPHPRDYRQGLFKFQSVDQTQKADRKPRREDLVRVIQDGIEGTAMPAHNLLPRRDLEAMVSYVVHLSIRGESEYETLKNAFKENMELDRDNAPAGPVAYLKNMTRLIGKKWLDSQSAEITPAPYPTKYLSDEKEKKASVQRGRDIFLAAGGGAAQASCVSCHKDFGRESLFRFDVWGTLVRPTNLTAGVYRGGRRPVDLYWRIHSGINGSGMVAFGSSIQGDQIWDLVNFLEALPYPAMRARYGIQVE